MTIEIPDEYLEPVKKMPAVKKSGKYKRMKDGDLLAWIASTKELCVVMTMVYRAIAAQSKKLGWVKFDPGTETWQGVDCNG